MQPTVLSEIAAAGASVTPERVSALVSEACPVERYRGRRVLLIVPDATRTAPVGLLFKTIYDRIGATTAKCDVMFALGTHPPMSEEAMNARLEITPEERVSHYGRARFLNHEWDNPDALQAIGTISAAEISALTSGLFAMDVEVKVNRRVFDYDELIIVGPVFPHEVVGFSGGNKYLFPGVSGPEVLNFFHWLGAVVTNPMIIGNKWTPVRKVVDHAASLVTVDKLCFSMVVKGADLAGLFVGTPERSWDEASELSRQLHIVYKDKPFHTVLSCAPRMYDELWVGGKCMYKLEPVVADGGELIIYAPHIHEVSVVHGHLIEELGYHCVDYFLTQWDRFKDYPWGTLAHSTHVRGIGRMIDGVEHCRVRVTLATGIPPETCARINMGYRDPATIDIESFADREDEGVLLVRKAGEMLYHLREQPEWAGGSLPK
ncbi:MAG TPA: lactate racemase domain-containing protein [Chthoniobacterales bacterium]